MPYQDPRAAGYRKRKAAENSRASLDAMAADYFKQSAIQRRLDATHADLYKKRGEYIQGNVSPFFNPMRRTPMEMATGRYKSQEIDDPTRRAQFNMNLAGNLSSASSGPARLGGDWSPEERLAIMAARGSHYGRVATNPAHQQFLEVAKQGDVPIQTLFPSQDSAAAQEFFSDPVVTGRTPVEPLAGTEPSPEESKALLTEIPPASLAVPGNLVQNYPLEADPFVSDVAGEILPFDPEQLSRVNTNISNIRKRIGRVPAKRRRNMRKRLQRLLKSRRHLQASRAVNPSVVGSSVPTPFTPNINDVQTGQGSVVPATSGPGLDPTRFAGFRGQDKENRNRLQELLSGFLVR